MKAGHGGTHSFASAHNLPLYVPLTPTLSPKRLCHNEAIFVIVILNPSPVILSPSLCHSEPFTVSFFYVEKQVSFLHGCR